MGGRAWRGRRIWPLAAALALHAGALALLMWRLGSERQPATTEIMHVELVPPLARAPDRRSPPAAAPAGRAPARRREPSPPAEETAAVPPPSEAGAAAGAAAEGVRPVLRGLLGCRDAGLADSDAERRERCAKQLARGRDPAPRPLEIDPTGKMAEDAVPYLARKPKNGCKLMAGGTRDPAGKEGAAFGFGCAWQF